MTRLTLDRISIQFAEHCVFSDVSMELLPAQSLCISTGVLDGSTSLLKAISGLLPITSGQILVDGKDIHSVTDKQRFGLVSLCFEHGGLISTFTNYNNVAFPMIYHAVATEAEICDRIMTLAPRLGVEECLYLEPHQLNDVQTRLVNLLRSLCVRPKLILLDELQSGMSEQMIESTIEVLQQQQQAHGFSMIMTTTAGDLTDFADACYKISNQNLELLV